MGTQANVIVGAATLYIAPSGTAEPSISATVGSAAFSTPTSPWVLQGFTEDGVKIGVDRKNVMIRVEEQSTPVLVVTDTTDVTIATSFAEDTIANMVTVYGGGGVTTVAASGTVPGSTSLALSDTLSTVAVFFTGANPAGFQRGVYIPDMVATGKVDTAYRRAAANRSYPTTFTAVCPMSSIVITELTSVVT